MNALAWILAATTASAGVDYGCQQTPDGQLEYIIQIEPSLMEALKSGQEITSEIPPHLAGVRRFRIRVGYDQLPQVTPADMAAAAASQTELLRQQYQNALNSAASLGGAAAQAVNDRTGGQLTAPGATSAAPPGLPNPNPGRWDPPALTAGQNPQLRGATGTGGQAVGQGAQPPSSQWGDRGRMPDNSVLSKSGPGAAATGNFGTPPQSPANPSFAERFRSMGQEAVSDANRQLTEAANQGFPPPRPGATGTDPSNRFQTPPPAPNGTPRFGTPRNPGAGQPTPQGGIPPAPEPQRAEDIPWFNPRGGERATVPSMDTSSTENGSLFAPRPLKTAEYVEPDKGSLADSVNTGRPTLPEEMATKVEYRSSSWLMTALIALFASLGANFYLGWIALELHRRYRTAVMQLTDAAALGA